MVYFYKLIVICLSFSVWTLTQLPQYPLLTVD